MKERITNAMFSSGDLITIVTTEDGLDKTFTFYDSKDNWACGVAMAWNGDEPFEDWVFENYEDYEDYMRGYNKAVEDKKLEVA